MANPTLQWDQMPVWGVYDDAGDIHLTVEERIRRQDGLMIYPGGKTKKVTIGDPASQDPAARSEVRTALRAKYQASNTMPGQAGAFDGNAWDVWWEQEVVPKAVFLYFYLADDPDITPNGWQVLVEERLESSTGRTYAIETWSIYLENEVPGINLGLQDPPPGSPAAILPVYAKGQPGGVAALDMDGDVVDSSGEKVTGGGTPVVVVDASATVKGIVELATAAETTTGVDNVRATTPAGVKAALDAAILAAAIPDATDTVKGKVELATAVETTTGTSTTLAATPAGVKAALDAAATPDASATVKGKVELATAAETTTGTDTGRATTPAGVKAALDAAIAAAVAALDITPPRGIFWIRPSGSVWEYTTYAQAQTAGLLATDMLVFAGTITPPAWASSHTGGPVVYFAGGSA